VLSFPTFFSSNVDRLGVLAGRRLVPDFDFADPGFRLRPAEIDTEQTIVEAGARHFDALRQDEAALELPRGNATMQIDALSVIGLLAADHELIVFNLNREIGDGKSGHGQSDAQSVLADLLDVVRRICVRRSFRHPIERALELVEPEQQGIVESESRVMLAPSNR